MTVKEDLRKRLMEDMDKFIGPIHTVEQGVTGDKWLTNWNRETTNDRQNKKSSTDK